MLCKFFKLRTVNTFDQVFMYDTPEKPANCMILKRFEKFEFNYMKAYLKDELYEKMPKNKIKLVELFG